MRASVQVGDALTLADLLVAFHFIVLYAMVSCIAPQLCTMSPLVDDSPAPSNTPHLLIAGAYSSSCAPVTI